MYLKKHLIIGFLLIVCTVSSAESLFVPNSPTSFNFSKDFKQTTTNLVQLHKFLKQRPSPILQLFRAKQKENKKIIAASLAFPLPFGIVGLHRIYLGSAPYVPVAYIASFGGMFGVLPFIDFCVLLSNKDINKYTNNQRIFMWVN
jgi:TM2 domain-containing membrane protein YozV